MSEKNLLIICFDRVPLGLLPRRGCQVKGIDEDEFARLLSKSEAYLHEERYAEDRGHTKDLASRGIYLPSRRIRPREGTPGLFVRHLDRGEKAVVLFISSCEGTDSDCVKNIRFEYRLITA